MPYLTSPNPTPSPFPLPQAADMEQAYLNAEAVEASWAAGAAVALGGGLGPAQVGRAKGGDSGSSPWASPSPPHLPVTLSLLFMGLGPAQGGTSGAVPGTCIGAYAYACFHVRARAHAHADLGVQCVI